RGFVVPWTFRELFAHRRGLLPGAPTLARRSALRPSLGEELECPLNRERFHRVAAADARVRLSVGDVGTEPPVFDHEPASVRGIIAELAEGRLCATLTASGPRLGENLEGLVQRHREELLLGL